ncbi:hypothetical protein WME94_01385 [Sorangium sp. So ce429]
MLNMIQRFHVAPLCLLLVATASCGPASALPGVRLPEQASHGYCPEYDDDPQRFADALMAGEVLPAKLTPCLPLDINDSLKTKLLEQTQLDQATRQLDAFGWQMFVALSWPVERRGEDLLFAASLAGPGAPRWRGWKTVDEVFNEGSVPEAWRYAADSTPEASVQLSSETQSDGKRLWDQHGRLVRYETLVNSNVHDYIVSEKLHTPEGQSNVPAVVFGWGRTDLTPPIFGAMVIKLAWKELDAQDQQGRFFLRTARLQPSDAAPRLFGLVGMHIAYKVSLLNPRWVWITFEHIDNVEETSEHACAAPAPPPLAERLFYDKQCRPDECPHNAHDSRNPRMGPDAHATQVVRKKPIGHETADFNCEVRALLHRSAPRSPAQYYKLVATQAAVQVDEYEEDEQDEQDDGDDLKYFPTDATNTMLETYQQETSSGCAQCHRHAPRLQERDGKFVPEPAGGDFMYMLTRRLQPKP